MQRYFAKKMEENQFILEDTDYHHIKNVMRMKEEEQIEIVYEQNLYVAHILYHDNQIKVIKEEQRTNKISKDCYITLIIPVLKEQKMDFILQKATELGVSEIIPVVMERCVVKVDGKEEKKVQRWRKIVKEASEQSKRLTIPKINEITSFCQLKEIKGVKLVCSTVENKKNIKNIMNSINNCDRISVVIGPEGGLSMKEEKDLMKKDYLPISLGNRILRVETVPLYLLSILNYENLL